MSLPSTTLDDPAVTISGSRPHDLVWFGLVWLVLIDHRAVVIRVFFFRAVRPHDTFAGLGRARTVGGEGARGARGPRGEAAFGGRQGHVCPIPAPAARLRGRHDKIPDSGGNVRAFL